MKNRALICLVIVVILLALSQGIDRGPGPRTLKAEIETPDGEKLKFEHRSVPVAAAGEMVTIAIDEFDIPEGRAVREARVFYRSSPSEAYRSESMSFSGGHGRHDARIPGLGRGEECQYYVMVTDLEGVRLSLPADAPSGGLPLTIAFEGQASASARFFYALFVYGALYLMLLASFVAFDVWLHDRRLEDCFPPVIGGLALLVVGGFPLAWVVARARTGSVWEGAHTVSTLIALLFWIVLLILARERLAGREEPRDPVGHRTFAALVIVGTVLTFILYAVPHRI